MKTIHKKIDNDFMIYEILNDDEVAQVILKAQAISSHQAVGLMQFIKNEARRAPEMEIKFASIQEKDFNGNLT